MARRHTPNLAPNGRYRVIIGGRSFWCGKDQTAAVKLTKASAANAITGRAVGFTMAMLLRRFASSMYAVRRSLERMRDKRQRIIDDPDTYRKEQIAKKVPEDFDELPDDEQMQIMSSLEDAVASVDPIAVREETESAGEGINLQFCWMMINYDSRR